MSWSVSKKFGSAPKVRAACEPEFDRCAAYYKGQAEEQDVLSAKTAMFSWLDACQASDGVIVEASGSRGDGWVSVKVECSKVPLLT